MFVKISLITCDSYVVFTCYSARCQEKPLSLRRVKNFFEGLSLSSLIAGALAAVTSFLLSAKIGIAGSVIGVAAGSIVSAVASQIYKNVLKASGEKLQDVTGVGTGSSEDKSDKDAHEELDKVDSVGRVISSDEGSLVPGSNSDDATRVLGTITHTDLPSNETSYSVGRSVSGRAATGRMSGAGHISQASLDATDRQKRIAIVIAIVSALAAVAATAGIVMLVTRGQGTDSVVRDWVNTTQTPTQQPSEPPADHQSGNDTDNGSVSGNNTDDTTDDAAKGDTSSSHDSTSNGNGTSSNTNDSTNSGNSSEDSSSNGTGTSSGSSTGGSGTSSGSTGGNSTTNNNTSGETSGSGSDSNSSSDNTSSGSTSTDSSSSGSSTDHSSSGSQSSSSSTDSTSGSAGTSNVQ